MKTKHDRSCSQGTNPTLRQLAFAALVALSLTAVLGVIFSGSAADATVSEDSPQSEFIESALTRETSSTITPVVEVQDVSTSHQKAASTTSATETTTSVESAADPEPIVDATTSSSTSAPERLITPVITPAAPVLAAAGFTETSTTTSSSSSTTSTTSTTTFTTTTSTTTTSTSTTTAAPEIPVDEEIDVDQTDEQTEPEGGQDVGEPTFDDPEADEDPTLDNDGAAGDLTDNPEGDLN